LFQALGADSSRPLIDRTDCLELVATGIFGEHSGRALQLHQQGFCLLRPNDPHWLTLLDQVRLQLEPLVDLSSWRTGADARVRISEGWRNPATPAVKALALHPEILELLRCCYGREPFAFQTLNFPVGSNQPFHSDAAEAIGCRTSRPVISGSHQSRSEAKRTRNACLRPTGNNKSNKEDSKRTPSWRGEGTCWSGTPTCCTAVRWWPITS